MQVNLFGTATAAKSKNVTSQRRVNLYAEVPANPDRSPFTLYPTPGLTLFADLSGNPIRGMYSRGSSMFCVQQGTLYEVSSSGTINNRGTLSTVTGTVCMSDNGAQLFIVDGVAAYTYTYATTTFAVVADADFPNGATTCTYSDRLFIVEKAGGQRFYLSGIDDGQSWDSNDFASADSNPDDLVRVYADHGELIPFGTYTTEFWGWNGATDFPYQRLTAIEWGLAAKWSVTKFSSSLMFLGRNRLGNVQVVLLNGYTPQAVSTPEIDTIINGYDVTSDATAFSYMLNGHAFYEITFPDAGKTWLYDGTSGVWSEVQSDGGRHRAQFAAQIENAMYVSDYQSGKLYLLDPSTYTENGAYITRSVTTRHVWQGGDFLSVASLWVDMETGVGLASGQGSDPQVMLRVSRDGGHSWSNTLSAALGKVGEYARRVLWRRLGRSRDFTFELSVSDPVKVVFLGGFMDLKK